MKQFSDMEIGLLITGIIIGFSIGYLYFRLSYDKTSGITPEEHETALEKIKALEIENGRLQERIQLITSEINTAIAQIQQEREKVIQLTNDLAVSRTEQDNLQQKLAEQKLEIEQLQEKFKTEFKNIANELLEDKSKRFTEKNQQILNDILSPLKEKIQTFEKKVEEAYDKELRDKISLKEEVKKLFELNQKISEEANNLTKALKSDVKKQGNWGELILEKVLERSGLVKDIEYKVQFKTTNAAGMEIKPDVVVFLPDNKHIIIDSKVSLVAYNNMINAETDAERKKYLDEHVKSVKNHIKDLSEKSYQSSGDLTAPDFVLMFMPIESSFSIAIQTDNELFNFAWDRKIVIVSPSTLLATLRTVASIWKQERQTRNALEIARQAGGLYDKFTGFINDLIEVGKRMDMAKSSYSDAMNKLCTGTGNIVKRIEELKKLGAKAEKTLPQALIDKALEN
jgi:DNA recombination protein RmuC